MDGNLLIAFIGMVIVFICRFYSQTIIFKLLISFQNDRFHTKPRFSIFETERIENYRFQEFFPPKNYHNL